MQTNAYCRAFARKGTVIGVMWDQNTSQDQRETPWGGGQDGLVRGFVCEECGRSTTLADHRHVTVAAAEARDGYQRVAVYLVCADCRELLTGG